MPPAKKEQAPAVTPAAIAAGLAPSAEVAQQQVALVQLAAAGAAFSTPQAIAELLQQGIPDKVTAALQQSPDKSVRLLACRQLAVYAAAGPGHPLQQAVALLHTTQVLWSVLQAYAEAEGAIQAALADPAALKAAAAKKLPGAKDPADPDDWLPGPSKYLLEAALRALSSLAACSPAAEAGAEGSPDCSSQQPCSWMASQEPSTVVALLQHASGRVQMRALRLALQLARSEAWCASCTAAGGVACSLNLAGLLGPGSTDSSSSGASVQLSALHLLARLVQAHQLAAAAVGAHRQQVLDSLMGVLLSAGSARPVTPAAAGASKAKGPSTPDATKQDKGAAAKESAVQIQQAAAELLGVLCCTDQEVCRALLQHNGLSALLSMMPDPPPVPGAQPQPEAAPEQVHEAGVGVDSGTPATTDNAGNGSGKGAVGAVPPLALGGDASDGAAAVSTSHPPRRQGAPTPRSRGHHGAAADGSSRPTSPPPPTHYAPPGTKLFNPQLQAQLLRIIARVLSQPGMVDTVLAACPQLPRLLLHMFAAGPVTPPPAGPASSGTGVVDAAAAQVAEAAAAGKAAPAPAAGANKGGQTPRSSQAAVVKGAGGPSQTGQLSGSGAATPRKTPAANTAAAAKAPEVAAYDLMDPPYATCTKAAALACLKHLCRHAQGAALLTAQTTAAAMSASPPAAEAPAGSWQQAQEQEAAQQAPAEQSDGRQCSSMLKQVLLDVQAMAIGCGPTADSPAEGGSEGSGTALASGGDSQQREFVGMLDDAAGFADGLVAHLSQNQLLELPMVALLQALAKCAAHHSTPEHLQQAVMRALLALPEDAFVPPPRPPLPSPPPTPPPPPLPTSLFAWDALERPCMTDGAVVVSVDA